ncbi:MAG: hypothetical protein COW00_00470 [Bdellovibrio sp. CG12_big_fil_rev_8_21_14_0_65_39_13]|nr:MAG: hypothetical protein COW78_04405 [Bdellovibrio sp. CG22_combo_CG10-13_8_21_14_all_39_27]PIQ62957.1 MAG: hypothetical protein COW00_00470 [Bdellovibrio sp. CG12_big_fil_rev_8_21_14_0_65_39_13]PIR32588.1 MAG: hypothetical protein COV37_19445 [Bdellovibrio sp. CG11_big_fil_rev_8_21_14_0_20_39_38]PJB54473.1 MAG: hypothetical protein CO099_01370 [Bdellovibrio sp. CG_4_9_14_3_um_filter_39_7]
MKLERFKLYVSHEDEMSGSSSPLLVVNTDHLVSVRPINIPHNGKILRAFWIRLANGKKYKAIEVPTEVSKLFRESDWTGRPLHEDSEELEALYN